MVVADERKEVNGWRKFRFLGYMEYVMNSSEKTKKTIEKFMPLPGDIKQDRGQPITNEQLLQTLKMYGDAGSNLRSSYYS